MNTAETRPAGLWSVEEIEAGVESMLFRQLLRERMRQTPNEVDRELQELALDAFEEWADGYGLPTTPHVLAAYLVELHSEGEAGGHPRVRCRGISESEQTRCARANPGRPSILLEQLRAYFRATNLLRKWGLS